MTFSLNEIEATAKKAARGAGYPWGLAEEAGKATRWLCAHDCDGVAALAALLTAVDQASITEWSPGVTGGVWRAPKGVLCPIATGAALSDRAGLLPSTDLQMGDMAQPIMLVPFAAMASKTLNQPISIKWEGADNVVDGGAFSLKGAAPCATPWVRVKTGGQTDHPQTPRSRAQPVPHAWRTLMDFAHRTYAPATDESRQKGAGAGLSDND